MSYTTIDHDIRRQFNLTLNEYAICDSIYVLSRKNYCDASRSYLGEFIGITKRSTINIINKLLEKELLLKDDNSYLATSDLWNKAYSDSKLPVKKVHLTGEESSPLPVKKVHLTGEESSPNKDIISTLNNNSILIFDYWNSMPNLTTHSNYNTHKTEIEKQLKIYNIDTIKKGIKKYNDITNLPDSLYSHKWILKDFLKRGLDRFVDDVPNSNFIKKNYKQSNQPIHRPAEIV